MPRDDGGMPIADAGPGDAGRDAAIDAGSGAATDGGSGVCSLVPQSGCGGGEACRRSARDGVFPHDGPEACEPAGPLAEGQSSPSLYGGCWADSFGGRDRCQAGLFCWTVCRRYCRSDSDCPPIDGTLQRCVPTDDAREALTVPYCAPVIGP